MRIPSASFKYFLLLLLIAGLGLGNTKMVTSKPSRGGHQPPIHCAQTTKAKACTPMPLKAKRASWKNTAWTLSKGFLWYVPAIIWKLSSKRTIAQGPLPSDIGTFRLINGKKGHEKVGNLENTCWVFGLTTLLMLSAWQFNVQWPTKGAWLPKLRITFFNKTQVVKDLLSAILVSYGVWHVAGTTNDQDPLPKMLSIGCFTTWIGWLLDYQIANHPNARYGRWVRILGHGAFASGLTSYLLEHSFVSSLGWAILGYGMCALPWHAMATRFWHGKVKRKAASQETKTKDAQAGLRVDLILLMIAIGNVCFVYRDPSLLRLHAKPNRPNEEELGLCDLSVKGLHKIVKLLSSFLLVLTPMLYPAMTLWVALLNCYDAYLTYYVVDEVNKWHAMLMLLSGLYGLLY